MENENPDLPANPLPLLRHSALPLRHRCRRKPPHAWDRKQPPQPAPRPRQPSPRAPTSPASRPRPTPSGTEIGKIIVGQTELLELLLTAVLADGHVLLEGVPGVAKTLMAKLLARTLAVPFSRIQFTPDLMPTDVLGTSVFRQNKARFRVSARPHFRQRGAD